jgi:hypothetical protein
MIQRTNNPGSAQQVRHGIDKHREPFWIPASNFYLLAFAASVAVFFLLVGILHDGVDDLPWVIGGAGSIIVLGTAVFVREVVMRNARRRFISAKRLDKRVWHLTKRDADSHGSNKLTLAKNETIIAEIRKKSEAAKVLGTFPETHKAVVELCEGYLTLAADELAKAGAGSPRIPAIRKGTGVASRHHRYHMLKWAEIEARSLTLEAKSRGKIDEALGKAEKALLVVDLALRAYPLESSLVDSQGVLQNFITSIRVSKSVETAEREFFNGEYESAIRLYSDAACEFRRYDSNDPEREKAAVKIDLEISRIREIQKRG